MKRNNKRLFAWIPVALLVLSVGCSEPKAPDPTEQWGAVYRYPALTDHDFLLKTRKGIFLVVFDADWCGWCRKMDPHLAALSDRMRDRLTIAKIDFDRNPEARAYYGPQGVPALFVVVDGRIVRSAMGYQDEERLLDLVRDMVEQYTEKSDAGPTASESPEYIP